MRVQCWQSSNGRFYVGPVAQKLRPDLVRHITASKLEASLHDVIAEYVRFELPFLWGSGKAFTRV
jgi:hypothetical protein